MAKTINTRIKYNYDTQENWESCNTESLRGELYIHSTNDSKIKLAAGDGNRNIKDLPYISLTNNVAIPLPSVTNSLTYNGVEQAPVWNNYDSSQLIKSGVSKATNAGKYSTTFIPQPGYCWTDGSITQKTVTWEIKKATLGSIKIKDQIAYAELNSGVELACSYTESKYGANVKISVPEYILITDVSLASDGISIEPNGKIDGSTYYDDPKGTYYLSFVNTNGAGKYTMRVVIEGNNVERAEFPFTITVTKRPLEDYSWSEIADIAATGAASSYFNIGDTKSIVLNGGIGTSLSISSEKYYVYIIDFDHYAPGEINFGTFKTTNGKDVCLIDSAYGRSSPSSLYFSMNAASTIEGGWKASSLRYRPLGSTDTSKENASASTATKPANSTLMAALPEDLRAVMIPMNIYTNNVGDNPTSATITIDYLPLPSEYEVFGKINYANTCESLSQKQFAYYADGNSQIKYKHSSTNSAAVWLLRSPASYARFCTVYSDGSASLANANMSYGIAPIFTVGHAITPEECTHPATSIINCKKICSLCGEILEEGTHTFSEPSVEHDGCITWTTYTCINCGYSHTWKDGEHTPDGNEVVEEDTCEYQVRYQVCTGCGQHVERHTVYKTIPTHNYVHEQGTPWNVCSICGDRVSILT